jgi:glycosyltransferase involved in cell wall biosynthesis
MGCGRFRGSMGGLISIIVATYNREDALDAVLRTLAHQSERNFEVLVADDGSGPETAVVVERWRSLIGVPILHVWHEDCGFRLAEIRNRAVAACHGEYCIFLDGDCLVRPDFVAAHRRLAARDRFVAGNRALLSSGLSKRVLQEGLSPETWSAAALFGARLRGDINRLAPLLRLPIGPMRRINATRWQGARGTNLAIRKSDLMRIDGFDSEFNGWGLEDSDIIVRLIRSGTRRTDGRFATGVLHLWHEESDRSHLLENRKRLDEILRGERVRAQRGLSALPQSQSVRAVASPAQ